VTLENKKCVGLGYWQFECRYGEKKKSYQKQSKTKLIFNYLFK
jgi:Fe-S-cluster-containing dehydrogenase component